MSESDSQIHPSVRKAAWAVVLVSLLPITMGAFVTTLKAGMAFADWPSSDGHNMLLYPWFQDFAKNPEKFVEHGHRLGGVLIGLFSIGLTAAAFWSKSAPGIRWFSVSILLSVIAQGGLGGARVLFDKSDLAMLHSITGGLFFCLCVMFLVTTGRRWRTLKGQQDSRISATSFAVIVMLPLLVFGQYLLGSSFRHLHTMLHEHIAGAVAVSVFAALALWSLMRSDAPGLKFCGRLIALSLIFQLLLGLGSFLTRLGFPAFGIVGTPGSWLQATICSAHTVGGMLLLASTVVSAASCLHMLSNNCLQGVKLDADLTGIVRPGGGAG